MASALHRFEARRVKTLVQEIDRRTSTGSEPLLSLSRGRGVVVRSSITDRQHAAASLANYKLCRPGELVMNRMQAWSGLIALSRHSGLISPDYAILVPKHGYDPRFLELRLTAPDMIAQYVETSKGIGSGFNRLYFQSLGPLQTSVPSLEEQGLIVRYLDHAELRIAKAIAAKQRMIKLLEEKRQVVAEEIILGRDQECIELLDSGVPWLGQVPKHWDLTPCRAYLRRRKVLVGRGYASHVLLSLTLRGLIVRDLSQMKGKFPASFESYQKVEPGDFVFCLFDVDETPRTVGLAHVAGMITGAYDVFECMDETLREYLYEYFLTIDRGKKLKPLYRGLRKTVPSNTFASMRIPIPPVAERAALVAKLKASTVALDAAIESLLKELALLKEYRTRLISDVVTGKLDVREEAAKLPEVDPMELATVAATGNNDDSEEEVSDGD